MLVRCVAVALALPGVAQASTITFNGDVMTIEGTDGVNGPILTSSSDCLSPRPGGCLRIQSLPLSLTSDPLTFPAGRCAGNESTVECDIPVQVIAMLGGGNDSFDMAALVGVTSELHGGAGADALYGGKSADKLCGEAARTSWAPTPATTSSTAARATTHSTAP